MKITTILYSYGRNIILATPLLELVDDCRATSLNPLLVAREAQFLGFE